MPLLTPPKLKSKPINEDLFSTPMTHNESQNKRKPEEPIHRTYDDLYNLIMNMNQKLTFEMKAMKEEMANVKNGMKDMNNDFTAILETKFQKINTDLGTMNDKLESVENKVNENIDQTSLNKYAIKALQQDKLLNKIDINGANIPDDKNGMELKMEVTKMINSFGININANDVAAASTRQFNFKDKSGKAIQKQSVRVEFTNFDTKSRVMKEKMKIKDHKGIFFNNALTSHNGYLMPKVKKITKDKNVKVFIKEGKINVGKSDGSRKIVDSEADLPDIKQWIMNNTEVHPSSSNSA